MNRNYAIEIRLLGYGSDRPLRYFKELASSFHGSFLEKEVSMDEAFEFFSKIIVFAYNLEKEQG